MIANACVFIMFANANVSHRPLFLVNSSVYFRSVTLVHRGTLICSVSAVPDESVTGVSCCHGNAFDLCACTVIHGYYEDVDRKHVEIAPGSCQLVQMAFQVMNISNGASYLFGKLCDCQQILEISRNI